MKKVAIYGQSYNTNSINEVLLLIDVLQEKKIVVFFEKEFYDLFQKENLLPKKYPTFSHFNDLNNSFDLFFTIGGDGTILRSITYIRNLNIPVLGINTGRLGFLATIQKEEINQAVELLLLEEYKIQERTLLSVKTTPKTEELSEINFALNEVTVARKNTTSMIGVKTFLDEEYLTNYWADGLIVSTPTGSTGYSLSCNGPVVLPDSKSLVITPIAPHNLNARPLVISENTKIKLEVSGREDTFLMSLDSRIATINEDTQIFIEKAAFTIKTIALTNQSFLKTLRSKLLWGEDTRNNLKH
ncbi:NAD kinase [Polaribacter gochangensis]|uniref:NAD kinase n=1 Tax=Polaribacter gochangensis TaxID=3252903 RepID=UPI003904C0F4